MKPTSRAGGLVVDAGQHAEQRGQFANLFVERRIGLERTDQATLADLAVALDVLSALIGGGVGHVLAVAAGLDLAEARELLQRVVDEVRVLDVHDEADVGEALVAGAVVHVVQHQHVERGQVAQAGRAHAVDDPARERIARDDQSVFELAQLGALGRHEVGRRDDLLSAARLYQPEQKVYFMDLGFCPQEYL